jgi:hypothetical protein
MLQKKIFTFLREEYYPENSSKRDLDYTIKELPKPHSQIPNKYFRKRNKNIQGTVFVQ